MLSEKGYLWITATGLFLSFTLFTAPLISMIAFTPGVGRIRQASAQEENVPLPPPTLPFTPFSIQQEQEEVPEEDEQQATTDEYVLDQPSRTEGPPTVVEETASPPTAADEGQTTFRPRDDLLLTPQPNEPTTRQGGEGQPEGGGSNATMPSSGERQIVSHVKEAYDRSRPVSCSIDSYNRIGRITGGGFNFASPLTAEVATLVFGSYPYTQSYGNGWGVGALYRGDEYKIYAVCAEIIASENAVNETAASSGSIYPTISVRESEVIIEPNRWKAVAAYCQEGEKIIGGGFGAEAFYMWNGMEVYEFPDNIRVYKNYPSGGNAWAVEAKNNHQSWQARLFAYAVCAKITIADSGSEQIESSVRYVPLTASPNSQNSVVASCQEGETITAGGWYSQSSDISVHKSYPSGNGWAVEAHNWNPTGARSLSVNAVCARIVSTTQQIASAEAPSSPGNETGEGEPIQEPGIPSPTNDTETTTTTPATNGTGGAVTELKTPSSSAEPPLRIEAIANATEAYAPTTIRFDANITGGAPPYSYNWYVPGFGVIDQDRSITQMFFEPGTFNYILTVTDSRGKVLTDNIHIVIYERLPPGVRGGDVVAPEPGGIAPPTTEEETTSLTVEIIPNATQVVAPATIEFDSNVTGGTEPYNYRWELLGGRLTPEYFEPQIVLMFPIPGMYTLVLNITDSNGRIGSDSVQITVGGLELPPSDDIGEVVPPTPEGGEVLLPPETGQEGQPLGGGGVLPLIPSPTDSGEAIPPEGGEEGETPDDTGEGEEAIVGAEVSE